jgi:hypothetical protein
MATVKLRHVHWLGKVEPLNSARWQPLAQPALEAHPVEVLAVSNWMGVKRVPHMTDDRACEAHENGSGGYSIMPVCH